MTATRKLSPGHIDCPGCLACSYEVDEATARDKQCQSEIETFEGLAHEIWTASQLSPDEGVTDGVDRIIVLLNAWQENHSHD